MDKVAHVVGVRDNNILVLVNWPQLLVVLVVFIILDLEGLFVLFVLFVEVPHFLIAPLSVQRGWPGCFLKLYLLVFVSVHYVLVLIILGLAHSYWDTVIMSRVLMSVANQFDVLQLRINYRLQTVSQRCELCMVLVLPSGHWRHLVDVRIPSFKSLSLLDPLFYILLLGVIQSVGIFQNRGQTTLCKLGAWGTLLVIIWFLGFVLLREYTSP